MRKTELFLCSLCHNGILGGGLYAEEEAFVYRTGKLTVDKKYRKLVLPYADTASLAWKKHLPAAVIRMKNGEAYTFQIFGRKRFQRVFDERAKE